MTIPRTAEQAILQGNLIEAIKIIRAEQKLGLKEAKDLVDSYLAANPVAQAQVMARSSNQHAGTILVFVMIGAAVVWWFVLHG